MSPAMYLELIKSSRKPSDAHAVSEIIDTMSHSERITLRTALEAMGCQTILQNLYYDYDKQVWIGMEDRA